MFKPVYLLVVVGVAAIAASAAAQLRHEPPYSFASGPQCFRVTDILTYTAGSGGTLNVMVGGQRWFRLQLSGDCGDLGELPKIGLRPMESSWLCEGKTDELIVGHHDGSQRCFVNKIERLPAS